MAHLMIEVVLTEDFEKLERERVMLKLASIGYIALGQKARLAGLRVPDERLSMNTGIISLDGEGRAMAYGIYIFNLIHDYFDTPMVFAEVFTRRRLNGVKYTMATEDGAVILKMLILCELLQAVI